MKKDFQTHIRREIIIMCFKQDNIFLWKASYIKVLWYFQACTKHSHNDLHTHIIETHIDVQDKLDHFFRNPGVTKTNGC